MMTIATRPAPDETPIIPGCARGFLITPCSSVPDATKHVPTINPMSTLGMRRSIQFDELSNLHLVYPLEYLVQKG